MSGRPHRPCQPDLGALTDAELHALLVRAQALLLDRPHGANGADLSVSVLNADEARLLALYRALPPDARKEGWTRIAGALTRLAGHGTGNGAVS